MQLWLVLHVRSGVRVLGPDTASRIHGEADGEPVASVRAALGGAHGLQRPHQGLPRLPQLPCPNHVQVNQGIYLLGVYFVYPSPNPTDHACM
jgi:hypothetical protein